MFGAFILLETDISWLWEAMKPLCNHHPPPATYLRWILGHIWPSFRRGFAAGGAGICISCLSLQMQNANYYLQFVESQSMQLTCTNDDAGTDRAPAGPKSWSRLRACLSLSTFARQSSHLGGTVEGAPALQCHHHLAVQPAPSCRPCSGHNLPQQVQHPGPSSIRPPTPSSLMVPHEMSHAESGPRSSTGLKWSRHGNHAVPTWNRSGKAKERAKQRRKAQH